MHSIEIYSEKRKWLIAISVFTGTVMSTIDTFILYIATPKLRGVFSATISEISWISTIYAVTSLIFMLISGWACTNYGRKNTYQFGLMLFVLSSLFCGLSTSLETLVVARLFQGIGAGLLLPIENVILRKTFPPYQHAIVMGIYGTTVMIGPSLGPILGGYIIDNYTWSMIFYINIPIGIIGFFLVKHYVPNDEKIESINSDFDWLGSALLAIGLFLLIWLLERGDRHDWFETEFNIILVFLSISCISYFCIHELKITNPVLDLRVLRNKIFHSTVILNLMLGFIVTATLFILPIYMQDILGYSPTQAGEAMAPRAIVMMFFFPIIGNMLNKYDPNIFIYVGLTIGIMSAILMSYFSHETSFSGMLLPQILQGLAVVLILVPLTTVGLKSVLPDELPSAAGIDSMARSIGGSLGIATFASLLTYYESHSWGIVRHNVSLSFNVFYKRFGTVTDYFHTWGGDDKTVVEQSFKLLSRRVEEQVSVISYMNLFQIIACIFIFMFLIMLFLEVRKHKENYQINQC